ncbi:MAG: redoxin family protein [Burkholderiales bacterium]|nr:redoxin family protein [Burkholderiales bacterium]
MKRILFSSLLIANICSLDATYAAAPGDRVDNFRLLDQNGVSHELRYLSDAKAVVLMVQGNGCPIVRQALPALRELRDSYRDRGVEFLLINSNLQDDRTAIVTEAKEFGFDIPVLKDEAQLVGEALGVERTAEVFVIDPKTWQLTYRGALDDRLDYEKQKPVPTKRYLADALDAMLAGQPVATTRTQTAGCLVNFPERGRTSAHAAISYSETIAPLLQKNCVACHRNGGVAPWAMTSYDMVRGFAPMIREVLRTKRMPPWHADPQYGHFVGDRSLSTTELQTLVHWIEAGAPRGAGPDPLTSQTPVPSEWTLGTPDLVVEVPAFDVPATGVVNYRYPSLPNPVGRDVWVRGVEVLPGDRSVVHHVLTGIDDAQSQEVRVGQLAAFGGYSPGKNTFFYPDDTGVLLRKNAQLQFQMHYTPNGKSIRDVTRVGYYFADKPPQHPLRLTFLYKGNLSIPPHAKAHTETVEYVYDRPVMVYTLMPHAHLRGKASRFTAVYPDGRQEVLLNVPKYDFNWQTVYIFEEPKVFPAGTRIVFDMTWDNSAQNPANPDPDKTVRWGDQTWEEMNAGWIRFRYLDEGPDAAKTAEAR